MPAMPNAPPEEQLNGCSPAEVRFFSKTMLFVPSVGSRNPFGFAFALERTYCVPPAFQMLKAALISAAPLPSGPISEFPRFQLTALGKTFQRVPSPEPYVSMYDVAVNDAVAIGCSDSAFTVSIFATTYSPTTSSPRTTPRT